MHQPDQAIARRDRPLLARIDLFSAAGLEARLIYPSHAPQTLGDKIVHYLLQPIMKLSARNHVMDFLSREGIKDLEAAKCLLKDIQSTPFRSVSEDEFATVLAEAALKNVYVRGNLGKLTEAHFRNPDHLEAACRCLLGQLNQTGQKALTAFIAFVRDPSVPLHRHDKRQIDLLLGEMHALRLPVALEAVLIDFQDAYGDAYENAVSTFGGFREPEHKSELATACDRLLARLPVGEKECIAAFGQFAETRKLTDMNRPLLRRFLTHFADHYAALDRETVISLLPSVISVDDALDARTLLEKLKLSIDIPQDEYKLASDLLFRVRSDSSYSPSAALALVGYVENKTITPESRVRLTYVASYPDLLLQSLPSIGDRSRQTAKRVIAELRKDLTAYAQTASSADVRS